MADEERYREAADTLDEVVTWLEKTPGVRNELLRRPNEIRAKAHHYRAKQFAAENNTPKQAEHLKKAIEHDPREADVLIALYRLPAQDEAAKADIRAKIKKVADAFRQQIASSPDDPQGMNQFAWLIANTEGDFDEATQWSHRSIELLPADSPGLGGLLDTLAHCYAAKKDYQKALEHQSLRHGAGAALGRDPPRIRAVQKGGRGSESEWATLACPLSVVRSPLQLTTDNGLRSETERYHQNAGSSHEIRPRPRPRNGCRR